MMAAAPLPLSPPIHDAQNLERGTVGIICLFLTEASLFAIFVTAYIFFIGQSKTGPFPNDVLSGPTWATICLLSSSVTVEFAVRALRSNALGRFKLLLAATVVLGAEFLRQTAIEWQKLIYHDGLTIATNVFGTTYYALVGLHATHVLIGATLLLLVLLLSLGGARIHAHEKKVELLGWYWHFVDAIWIVVFTVVYGVGR
jgi:cytochrome c oxidase subunit 3